MTEKNKSEKKPKLILLITVLAVSALFTLFSDSISLFAKEAAILCAASVIPSLFPFMVLSSLASKAASYFTGGASPVAAVVLSFFLGALCGFPVGAATVAGMYKNGALKKDLAEQLCGLCNNTGPAFVIGVIGGEFWRSAKLGVIFYICQLIAAGIVFAICRFLKFPKISGSLSANAKDPDSRKTSFSANAVKRFSHIFCSSVGESVISVLQISGYIIFFKVLCDTLRMFLPKTAIFETVYTAISSFLEFTTASSAAASLGKTSGILFCGFAIGFSGLSVMAQSAGILAAVGLSVKPLFIMKFFIGLISAFLSVLTYSTVDFAQSASAVQSHTVPYAMIIISAGIIFSTLILLLFSKFVRVAR